MAADGYNILKNDIDGEDGELYAYYILFFFALAYLGTTLNMTYDALNGKMTDRIWNNLVMYGKNLGLCEISEMSWQLERWIEDPDAPLSIC